VPETHTDFLPCLFNGLPLGQPRPVRGYRTPRQIYQEGLWICGRSALPTGSASPTSLASSESGEMLAFAHIPTGAAANKGFDVDRVKS
jgi:hypothetical protein